MATGRTTIVLRERERRAAKRLADLWGVTPSEAIRRAVIKVDEAEIPASRERARRARAAALEKARVVFAAMDVDAEIDRINSDRDEW
jgi:hypothetical protein